MEMFRRTYADINLDHLIHNFLALKNVANDDRFICPMVKANAYGHGDVQVSLALEKAGAEILGVCLIEEGLLLRSSGVKAEILVFRGFDRRGAEKILEYQMSPVVSTWQQIESLEAAADEPVKVHLKFNTGMNRLGFNLDQAEKLRDYFKKSKKLKLKAVLTHFAAGEDSFKENGFSFEQTQAFIKVYDHFKDLDVYAHLLNSGGIAGLAKVQNTPKEKNHYLNKIKWGFRPGLMLYGYQPAPIFNEIPLKPVMTLKSVVNNIRLVKKNESVSYGCTWTAEKDTWVAVVPIGYADGVHRLASNKGQALFCGKTASIIGRICMDFIMLDVSHIIEGQDPLKFIEEEVVLFGFDENNVFHSAENLATVSDTIVWETLTSVGERVPRHYKGTFHGNQGLVKL